MKQTLYMLLGGACIIGLAACGKTQPPADTDLTISVVGTYKGYSEDSMPNGNWILDTVKLTVTKVDDSHVNIQTSGSNYINPVEAIIAQSGSNYTLPVVAAGSTTALPYTFYGVSPVGNYNSNNKQLTFGEETIQSGQQTFEAFSGTLQ